MSTLEYMLLTILETQEVISGVEILSRYTRVMGESPTLSRGTLYTTLNRMRSRGWILGHLAEDDRRYLYLEITDLGYALVLAERQTYTWLSHLSGERFQDPSVDA